MRYETLIVKLVVWMFQLMILTAVMLYKLIVEVAIILYKLIVEMVNGTTNFIKHKRKNHYEKLLNAKSLNWRNTLNVSKYWGWMGIDRFKMRHYYLSFFKFFLVFFLFYGILRGVWDSLMWLPFILAWWFCDYSSITEKKKFVGVKWIYSK